MKLAKPLVLILALAAMNLTLVPKMKQEMQISMEFLKTNRNILLQNIK